jgi:chromosome segregation ATPase
MYLRRLELQGFKTFAAKTVLEFHPQSKDRRGLTGIVGPNGSGKSNIADAVRWVMGEQSMKLLRSKKSEDVIFSGSSKKSRSGFAEVSLTLVNDDHEDIDLHEIVVTRRLYRDGNSEYEVNRQSAKHGDVILLLAQAGIGQRTYSVIGQGMVDAVLVASPAERKEFFDEAAGLRPFQLKRHQSVNKLDATKVNLSQAEALLREIGPRLSTLDRQVKRLQDRANLEQERDDLERRYYGGTWHDIFGSLTKVQTDVEVARGQEVKLSAEAKSLEAELAAMEKAVPASKEFAALRASLDELSEERVALREKRSKLEAQQEISRAKSGASWAPLPLSKIIEAAEETNGNIDEIWKLLESPHPDLDKIKALIAKLRTRHESFVAKLQQPAPEAATKSATDPKIEKELEEVARNMAAIAERASAVQEKLNAWNKKEEGERSHLFETQRKLNQKRMDAQAAERRASDASVELARWETRRDGFLTDLRTQRADWEPKLNALAQEIGHVATVEQLLPRLTRVRSQLEWIGSIDPETLKEHGETKKRFEFLSVQIEDLRGAINGLETVIRELDETIQTRSETSFHVLNREFGKFFNVLFNGGEAKLIQLEPEPVEDEEGNVVEGDDEEAVAGIDIQATPPGKRLKNIALLSGGERALTSIALIYAIMATNPSPFVVLDEVDAALDESNSKKFAEILHQLSDRTQFIVVTHNRATMHQASVLYGVTMGEDGTSQLLSVKLSDVMKS